MVPGFVQLGAWAVLLQLLVIGGFYGYLWYRYPVGDPVVRRRVVRLIIVGSGFIAVGQIAALGAIGSLQTHPLLSIQGVLLLQDIGLGTALIGYIVVIAGVVIHGRARDQ